MNKKGLILIFLFVVSTVGFVAISNAATDNKVEVTINYIPSGYVEMGYCWVEFDTRFVDDNSVFGQNDDIYFAFYYDVPYGAWFGAVGPGGGMQPDEWFYADQNNVTEGYTGSDLYNVTRFSGWFDVTLDGYDLGPSNFDISGNADTYQDIILNLDIGWHYLAITAAELVSDANHTEWHWEYASDSKRFYVAENKDVIPTSVTQAYYNWVDVSDVAVNSEDLVSQYYTIAGWLDNPRPVAEANQTLVYQVEETLGTDTTNVTTDTIAYYNCSDTDLVLTGALYGVVYNSIYEMGTHTNVWRVNNLEPVVWNGTDYIKINDVSYEDGVYENNGGLVAHDSVLPGLNVGQNYVYLYVFGSGVDDIALDYAHPVPRVTVDLAIFGIWIGDLPESTGLGFGILISVSILGLAAALYFVRRRR